MLLLLLGLPAHLFLSGCSSAEQAPSPSVQNGSKSGEGAAQNGCGGRADASVTGAENEGGSAQGDRSGGARTVIAVLQIVSQPVLNAVVEGFLESLREAGYAEPETRLLMENAQGDEGRAQEIAEQLEQTQPDLVFTVSQPASQAAARVLDQVPVVFAAVTDPRAAGLERSGRTGRDNITGVSDMLPARPHLELVRRLVPEAERIGLIYNPAEADSLAQVLEESMVAAEMGLKTVEVRVADSSEVLAAAESLVGRVEAISVLRDSTVLSALESVVKVCTDHDLPLLAGDSDSVQRGAAAAWTLDYREHGRQAGRMAVRILKGTAPSEIPVEQVEKLSLAINEASAAEMGLTLPAGLRAEAKQTY